MKKNRKKIKALFRKTKAKVRSDKEPCGLNALSNNPYLQSKALWNDLYGDLQTKLENSYRLIFVLSMVIALAIVGFMIVAGESKVKPYVTVIHGNEVLTLDQTSEREWHALQPQLALYFTQRFIRSARVVSTDATVNAQHKIAAYAMVGGAATERLKQFYRAHPSDTIAQRWVNTIHITSVLRTSPQTIEVRWREDRYARQSGQQQSSHDYLAALHYVFGHSSDDPRILRVNPFGFTITQLSWSEDQYAQEANHHE